MKFRRIACVTAVAVTLVAALGLWLMSLPASFSYELWAEFDSAP